MCTPDSLSQPAGGPLRGALVGAGDVTRHHLHAWAQIPQAAIVAIADPDLERAQTRAREAGIGVEHAYRSFDDLLAAESALDFVDIAAPPEVHVELVRQVAARGLPVLCQKPFAASLPEAWTMIALAERAGVLLSINENWRWRAWYRALKTMLDAGAVGQPVYARFFAHADWWLDVSSRSPDHRFRTWTRTLLFDWGLHLLDILRWLFGEPQSVYARVHRVNPALRSDDYAIVMLTYPCMTALVDIAMVSHDPAGHSTRHDQVLEDFRIEGDAGTLCLVPDRGGNERIRLTTAEGTREQPAYTGAPHDAYLASYTAAQQHFIDCLRAGTLPETHARDNVESLAIMLAAYHSAETGRVVALDDFKRRARPDSGDGR